MRELGANVSLSALNEAFGSHDLDLPDGPVISGYLPGNLETELAFEGKEVTEFRIKRAQRRVDLKWEPSPEGDGTWLLLRDVAEPQRRTVFETYESRDRHVTIARTPVVVEGPEGETCIEAFNRLFVLPETPVGKYVNDVIDRIEDEGRLPEGQLTALFIEMVLRDDAAIVARDPNRAEQIIERRASSEYPGLGPLSLAEALRRYMDFDEFASVLRDTEWRVFDPAQWLREPEE